MSNSTNHGAGTPAAPIPGFASETADVGGVRLHYRVGGDSDGPPVLLWHGFLGTGYAWRKVAPALADAGMSVLVPDMRGYGDYEKPEGTEGYDARALAEEFRALMRRIGLGAGGRSSWPRTTWGRRRRYCGPPTTRRRSRGSCTWRSR